MNAPSRDRAPNRAAQTAKPASATGCPHGVMHLPHPHLRFAALANAFGFDGASYFLFGRECDSATPDAHWSTAGTQWLQIYRRHDLHRIDPRLIQRSENMLLVWSADSAPLAQGCARFVRLGTRFGIGSGVALPIRDERSGRAIMCWDFSAPGLSVQRQHRIADAIDTLALVSGLLLESVRAQPHRHRQRDGDDPCLTARESECLALAANGMTSGDIGVKLGISQRTANFHFGNIIAKLQALNRGEAIARAIALGLYQPAPPVRADPS